MSRNRLVFWSVQKIVHEICQHVGHNLTATYGADFSAVANAYEQLAAAVRSFAISYPRKNLDLDEDLYGYVQSLEFLHHAIGMPELLTKAIPQCTVVRPVEGEILEFTQAVCMELGIALREEAHVPLLSISEMADFVMQRIDRILSIVNLAMGWNLAASDITFEILVDSQRIVHNYRWFLRVGDFDEVGLDDKLVSPWMCIGALICILHSRSSTPAAHAPYWRLMVEKEGQKVAQPTRSLRKALKDTFSDQTISEKMTLEHRHIWRTRLDWFCNSLNGMGPVVLPSLQFRVSLTMKLMDILRQARDVNTKMDAHVSLHEHIKSTVVSMYQSSLS
jgi:hypothetical protein